MGEEVYEYQDWTIEAYWTGFCSGWGGTATNGNKKFYVRDCESVNHVLSRCKKKIDRGGPFRIV